LFSMGDAPMKFYACPAGNMPDCRQTDRKKTHAT